MLSSDVVIKLDFKYENIYVQKVGRRSPTIYFKKCYLLMLGLSVILNTNICTKGSAIIDDGSNSEYVARILSYHISP